MSDSVPSQLLTESLSRCIRERFTVAALDQLCDTLERALRSIGDRHAELYEALTNYVYQLRDGAIQASEETTLLFREALTLLSEDEWSPQRSSLDDHTARLLERIDLEASGGFDALEAGEVPDVDTLNDPRSETLRIQNTLHRLHTSLEMIERHSNLNQSSASFKTVFSHHRRLLQALIPQNQPSEYVSLTSLAETLSLQAEQSGSDMSFVATGSVHSTYFPSLSSLLAQFTNTLATHELRAIQISREHDELNLLFRFELNESHVSGLRANAIKQGFLNADAPLPDGHEMQYLLLSESVEASDLLIHESALLDLLQSLCAKVVIETTTGCTRICATLPADARSERVTVFKHGGALYAVLTDTVTDIDYSITQSDVSFRSSLENNHGSFRVVNLDPKNDDHEACLFIDDGGDRVALFAERIEPPGQLIVLDSLTAAAHLGGGVRLQDRRVVVLLSTVDLDEIHQPSFAPRLLPTRRLLAIDHATLAKSLSQDFCRVSFVSGELDSTAALQEQRPHAILIESGDLSRYARLLSKAKSLNIPVIVHQSAGGDKVDVTPGAEFRTITNFKDLETELQKVSVQSV